LKTRKRRVCKRTKSISTWGEGLKKGPSAGEKQSLLLEKNRMPRLDWRSSQGECKKKTTRSGDHKKTWREEKFSDKKRDGGRTWGGGKRKQAL